VSALSRPSRPSRKSTRPYFAVSSEEAYVVSARRRLASIEQGTFAELRKGHGQIRCQPRCKPFPDRASDHRKAHRLPRPNQRNTSSLRKVRNSSARLLWGWYAVINSPAQG